MVLLEMPNFRKVVFFASVGIIFVFVGIFIFSYPLQITLITPTSPAPSFSAVLPASDSATFARVTRVFDGDTIEIEGGQKVRYIGIDAAEVYPTQQCFSNESLIKNRELVLGKTVRLEKDISETDKYGRLLRFVYVGDTFIDDYLVRNGYAKIMTIQPDVKYQNQFLDSEKYAKENNLGLWSNCF